MIDVGIVCATNGGMKLNNWKPETRSLIASLQKAGLTIHSQHNGEYGTKFSDVSRSKFIEDLIACDESRLYVVTPEGKKLGLFLVLGNSPGELVCDYHCHPLLDAVTETHYKKWNGRKQPTIES